MVDKILSDAQYPQTKCKYPFHATNNFDGGVNMNQTLDSRFSTM